MTDLKRKNIFWTSCIPIRIVLASAMVISEIEKIRSLQIILAIYFGYWAIGYFLYFARTHIALSEIEHATGKNREELQTKHYDVTHGNFGGPVWWQWHRLVHGILLSIYSVFTFLNVPYAYVFAIADVTYGFMAGLLYYYKSCFIANAR